MKKRTGKAKKTAAEKKAWFEQKVAELGAALKKLPADRQEQLRKELDRGKKETAG